MGGFFSPMRNFLGQTSKSKEERRLVQKLDFFILTYCCFCSFFNYLDRAAFANAYVTGLREALHMSGHDYNTVLSVTQAGIAVGTIPHGIIIQRIPPRFWLPSMAGVWAVLTMVTSTVKNTSQLCVVRFFLGMAEASTYAGTMYIIGSWYKPSEIAKRTAIFTGAGQVGTMFAGAMMTAIYKTMRGVDGLEGWQWVFLIDGIITLPVAIFGILYFPDIPEITKASYLSASEKELAKTRLPQVKKDGHNIQFLSLAKRLLLTPTFWILLFWSPIGSTLEAYTLQSNLLLWLKYHSDDFSPTQINMYPLGVQAVGIVSNILGAWQMDATGTRVPMCILTCLLQLVCASMLLVPNLPYAGTFFAYYLSGSSYIINALIFGWANIILQRGGDDAVRSVTLYAMALSSQVLYTFWGIVLYPADDAPYWKKGSIAMIVCCFVVLAYMWVVDKLDKTNKERLSNRSDDGLGTNEADGQEH